jgi:hypothetical protein
MLHLRAGTHAGKSSGYLQIIRPDWRHIFRWGRRGQSSIAASVVIVSLCQSEWDHANGDKDKHVKCAPKKMRFNIWISLFFHVVSSLLE